MNEAGRVVVTFTVDADGKAAPPFAIDPEQSVVTPRLVEAVNVYLQHVRFATGPQYKRLLTASFVFELESCGTLKRGDHYDYAINVCAPPPKDPWTSVPGCMATPNQITVLSSTDVTSPMTFATLLANIRLAAQSHWLERDDFYDERFLKKLFGAKTIQRQELSSPGSETIQMPPGTFDNFEIHGRLKIGVPKWTAKQADYRLTVTRATTGELPGHVLRQLTLAVSASLQQDVNEVWGFGTHDGHFPHATDGGIAGDTLMFYKCQQAGWVETLYIDPASTFRLDVTRAVPQFP
jgi:hypothetical protein